MLCIYACSCVFLVIFCRTLIFLKAFIFRGDRKSIALHYVHRLMSDSLAITLQTTFLFSCGVSLRNFRDSSKVTEHLAFVLMLCHIEHAFETKSETIFKEMFRQAQDSRFFKTAFFYFIIFSDFQLAFYTSSPH